MKYCSYSLLVNMDAKTHYELQWLADEDGRSMNDVIRRLINDRYAQLAPVVAVAQQEQEGTTQ